MMAFFMVIIYQFTLVFVKNTLHFGGFVLKFL